MFITLVNNVYEDFEYDYDEDTDNTITTLFYKIARKNDIRYSKETIRIDSVIKLYEYKATEDIHIVCVEVYDKRRNQKYNSDIRKYRYGFTKRIEFEKEYRRIESILENAK